MHLASGRIYSPSPQTQNIKLKKCNVNGVMSLPSRKMSMRLWIGSKFMWRQSVVKL